MEDFASRASFDASGYSNGSVVGTLMAEAESEIIGAVKSVFRSYPDKPLSELDRNEWQTRMLSNVSRLEKAAEKSFLKRQKNMSSAVSISLENAYKYGANTTLEQLGYRKLKVSLEPSETGTKLYDETLTKLIESEAFAITDARNKFIRATALIASGAAVFGTDKLYRAIDELWTEDAAKGFTGKITSDGKRMSLTNYSEALTRENSQQSLLHGQGAVAGELGLKYVQILSKPTCCPLCQRYAYKILVDDIFAGGKSDGKTETLSRAMDNGLFHWNCRCTKVIFIPGKTKTFEKPVGFDEKTAVNYAIEQRQRVLQREIREYKNGAAASLTLQQKTAYEQKIEVKQKELRDLLHYAKREGYRTYRQGWKEAADYKKELRSAYSVSDRVDVEIIPKEIKNAPFRATRVMELGQAKEVKSFAEAHNFVSLSDEIVITDERIAHITERHSDVYFKYKNMLVDLIANPIDIRESKKPNTVEILSEGEDSQYVHIILKLADKKGYRASIITMYEMNEKKKTRYLKH